MGKLYDCAIQFKAQVKTFTLKANYWNAGNLVLTTGLKT